MTLSESQRLFARRMPRLIDYINDNGYECTLGDAFRDPRSHGHMGEYIAYGRRWSAHKQRLAIDLNLFLDGKYLFALCVGGQIDHLVNQCLETGNELAQFLMVQSLRLGELFIRYLLFRWGK